jgi:hypothetical protein
MRQCCIQPLKYTASVVYNQCRLLAVIRVKANMVQFSECKIRNYLCQHSSFVPMYRAKTRYWSE